MQGYAHQDVKLVRFFVNTTTDIKYFCVPGGAAINGKPPVWDVCYIQILDENKTSFGRIAQNHTTLFVKFKNLLSLSLGFDIV